MYKKFIEVVEKFKSVDDIRLDMLFLDMCNRDERRFESIVIL